MLIRLVKALYPNIFFINFFKSHIWNYLVPKNINLFWNCGFLLAVLFLLQLLTGLLLIYIYYPIKVSSFASVANIMVEANIGWFIRLYHSLGVSVYFLVMFIHAIKGIWISSKTLAWSWQSGVFLLGSSIMIAFMGYMLPNGQMSFWGATVIANLLGVLGETKVLVFGGYVINEATLKRFYLWHCIFPFFVLWVMYLHMFYLHRNSSTHPLPIAEAMEALKFFPSSSFSDVRLLFALFVLMVIQIGMGIVRIFQADPDNSIESDAMMTPSHIIPEWYLLLFYATLKVFPTKITGLLAIFAVFELLIILTESRSFTEILSSSCFYRTWTLAGIALIPFWFVLSFVGKMVITSVLIAIGLYLVNSSGTFVGRLLESAKARFSIGSREKEVLLLSM